MNTMISTLWPAAALMILVSVLWNVNAHAEDEESMLAQSSLHLDYKADKTGRPDAALNQIKSEFNVSEERVYSLRQKNLTYGDISTVLSLAEQMPGGINDRNVNKIVMLRQGSGSLIGWGSIAKALRVRMARAVDHTEAINASTWSDSRPMPAREDRSDQRPGFAESRLSPQVHAQMPSLEDGLKPGN